MDTNVSKELKLANIYVKEEITDELEPDQRQEEIICKRAYYQCITCQATFTEADKLKDHESIHKGEKSKVLLILFSNLTYYMTHIKNLNSLGNFKTLIIGRL